jgi:hypothetical protein
MPRSADAQLDYFASAESSHAVGQQGMPMDNRIRQLVVHDRSLMPAQAEVWITVVPEYQTPTTEVRGRLMGPRCPYAGTVEVAYPLRPLPSPRSSSDLTMRAIIPEASLWEPQCPFLYEGPVELWQDGRCCHRVVVRHGLRSVQLNERALLVNGRPLTLHGRTVADYSEDEVLMLRRTGCNLLVAPIDERCLSLGEIADRLGFLLLGRVREDNEMTRRYMETLSQGASCLGWLLEESDNLPLEILPKTGLVGLIYDSPPRKSSLSAVDFLLGPVELANLGKPLLVTGDGPSLIEGRLLLGYIRERVDS